jgi:DNA polymerase-3 subunit gamma/tau
LRVATTQPEPEPELQHGTPARNAIEALGNVLAGMSRGNAALAAEPANAVAPPVYHEPVRQRPAPPRIEPGFDGGPTPDFGFEPDFGLQPDSGSVSDFDPGDADLPASNGAPRLSLVKSALATAPADAASDLAAEVPTAEAPTAEVPAAEVPAAVDDAARSPIQIGAIPDQAGWPAFVTRLPASGLLRQMLERTQLESFVSDQGRHAVLLSVGVKAYLDPVHAQRASQLLSDVFQSGVTVKVQLGAATLTAAALAEQQNRERMAQADAAVRQDPFVQVLQTRLGAQIVPGSIRPLSRSGELS